MYVCMTDFLGCKPRTLLVHNQFLSATVFKSSLQGCSQAIRPHICAGIGDCPDPHAAPTELREVHMGVFIVPLSLRVASFSSRVSSANLLGVHSMPLSFMKMPYGVAPCTDSWRTALVPGFSLDSELLTLTPWSPNKYVSLQVRFKSVWGQGHIRAFWKILCP